MFITSSCIPCFIRQATNEIEGSGLSEEDGRRLLSELKAMFDSLGTGLTPVDVSVLIHAHMLRGGGVDDPYEEVKRISTEKALKMREWAERRISRSVDPLREAALLSIAGNVIDYGAMNQLDMRTTLSRMEGEGLGIDHFKDLRSAVASSREAVFLLDNTGEAVFDGLLMEEMIKVNPHLRVRAYAKRNALLNDVTLKDAMMSGLNGLMNVELLELSDDGWVKPQQLKVLSGGSMIISKGQGNYENLSDEGGIFFLLVVKCPVVGEHIGAEVGDMVLKYSPLKAHPRTGK